MLTVKIWGYLTGLGYFQKAAVKIVAKTKSSIFFYLSSDLSQIYHFYLEIYVSDGGKSKEFYSTDGMCKKNSSLFAFDWGSWPSMRHANQTWGGQLQTRDFEILKHMAKMLIVIR